MFSATIWYFYSVHFPDEKTNFREVAKTWEKTMNYVPFILVEDK